MSDSQLEALCASLRASLAAQGIPADDIPEGVLRPVAALLERLAILYGPARLREESRAPGLWSAEAYRRGWPRPWAALTPEERAADLAKREAAFRSRLADRGEPWPDPRTA